MLQPDLGSAMAFLAIGSLMLLFAGIRRITIISGLVIAMIAVPMGWPFLKQHQKLRVQVWLDPEKDPKGSGYHIIQSKIAVGSGGLLGKGFTQGSQSQLAFLPEHTTDFIFSVLAEEWGFIGSGAVLALYFLLLSRILRVSSRARDLWSALVVFGIASLIFFHLLINIGMVVGLLPVVGLPLPLFSYGGSSVVTILVGLGLVLGISMRRYALATRG
jgi:rod shape determining protein RodA